VSQLTKDIVPEELLELAGKIVRRTVYTPSHYEPLTQEEKAKKAKTIILAFKYFDLLNPLAGFYKPEDTILENLVHLLETKIKLKEEEADLVVMQHVFKIKYENKPLITLKSSLLLIGDKHGRSAMSKTVGTPTAIGAQLILDGQIKQRGVIIPVDKEVY